MSFKLFDKIKRILRKRGYIVRSPVKKKHANARKGQCKFIEPYDLDVDFREKVNEETLKNDPYRGF